jgi:hypothetical protein
MRLFQNFSFGTATLDLIEKAGFRPLFRKPVPKPTEFWNRLKYIRFWQNLIWAHFRLRRKPGFTGVPPLARPMATCGGPAPPEANPQRL